LNIKEKLELLLWLAKVSMLKYPSIVKCFEAEKLLDLYAFINDTNCVQTVMKVVGRLLSASFVFM